MTSLVTATLGKIREQSTQDREHRHSISPFGDVDEGVDLSLFDGYDDSLVPSDVVDDDQL